MVQMCRDKPGALVGYLTKTRDWAEELVWEPLKQIVRDHGLRADVHNAKLRCAFSNGSKIRLASAKDKSQTEPLRGFGYDLFVIDECGSIDPVVMRYIVREILPAALGEKKGQLLLIGTPNESCAGYFHEMTTKPRPGCSVHHWTQRENTEFPLWAKCKPEDRNRIVDEYLALEREKWGYSETDPEYLREYMGIWARDEGLFIYRITDDNLRMPPTEHLRYVLVIDLGWHDMTAFELVGYDQHSQVMYEVDSTQDQHLTLDRISDIAKKYAETYELDSIVIDTAGAGKIVQESMAVEMGSRFAVPVRPAQKTRKATNMKLLASDFRTGRACLLPGGVCADQMRALQWDEGRLIEKEPEPGAHIDNADAYLYGYRECYHWLHEEREAIPADGTAERLNYEMAKIEEEEAARIVAPSQWWEQ